MSLAVIDAVVTDNLIVGTFGGITGFKIDKNGNILKLNNVATSFPSVQGGSSTVLTNDGAGVLSWVATGTADPYGDLLSDPPTTPGTTYTNTYSAGKITQEVWKRTAGLTNIRTIDYTYTGGSVTTEVVKVFATDGTTIVAQTTRTYTYTTGKLTGEVMVRNV
jgi:hypothetical protein